MAFAGGEEVIAVIENLLAEIWNGLVPGSVTVPFIRMTYRDAMLKVISSLTWN